MSCDPRPYQYVERGFVPKIDPNCKLIIQYQRSSTMTWTEKRRTALNRMWNLHTRLNDDDRLTRILVALAYLDERLQRGRTDVR